MKAASSSMKGVAPWLAGQLPQGWDKTRRTGQRSGRPMGCRHPGPRPVGRQLQDGQRASEPFFPEGEMLFQHAVLQPLSLPDGKIAILQGKLREGRGLSHREGRVERGDLARHHALRPAVGDDVVHRDQERVLVPVQPEQGRAKQRSAAQVERPQPLFPGEVPRFSLPRGHGEGAEIDDRQRRLGARDARTDLLNELPIDELEGGPQDLVPADDLGHASPQSPHVERPEEPERRHENVGRAAGLQAIEEP